MARADSSGGLTPFVAVGAGLGAAWLVTRGRRAVAATGPDVVPAAATESAVVAPVVAAEARVELPPGRWVWPLPRWQGRAPVISDGWGSPRDGGARRHLGADVMYRRRSLVDLVTVFPPGSPHSLWHFVPDGTLALAAADATIWSAGRTARGFTVVLSHGKPWATYYTHLASLLVPETARGAGGHRVTAGQPLGIVGADPMNPTIRHLHFEIWKGGDHRAAIDPAPILRRLAVVDPAPAAQPPAVEIPGQDVPASERAHRFDPLFARHGRGIPVAYLRALAQAESGMNPDDPHGLINVVAVALADYNRRHPTATITTAQLRDPVANVVVAVDILRTIIASYAAHHPRVVNLLEDWTNPHFVDLLSAGWNAGFSERAGVGRVVQHLVARGVADITLDRVFAAAPAAGAASTLTNPAKLAFARTVTAAYLRDARA